MPTGDWGDKDSVSVWTLSLRTLFSMWFLYKKEMLGNDKEIDTGKFVLQYVFSPTITDIADIAMLNREGVRIRKQKYDVDEFEHPKKVINELEQLDKKYVSFVTSPRNMSELLEQLPSVNKNGLGNTLAVPDLYPMRQIDAIVILAKLKQLVTLLKIGGGEFKKSIVGELQNLKVHLLRIRRLNSDLPRNLEKLLLSDIGEMLKEMRKK